MDKIAIIGSIALLLAAVVSLIVCFTLAVKRERFTIRMLFVALTAACVLAAFLASARDAARRNSIKNLEFERKIYQDNRSRMNAGEYQRRMSEIDARAVELGVGK